MHTVIKDAKPQGFYGHSPNNNASKKMLAGLGFVYTLLIKTNRTLNQTINILE